MEKEPIESGQERIVDPEEAFKIASKTARAHTDAIKYADTPRGVLASKLKGEGENAASLDYQLQQMMKDKSIDELRELLEDLKSKDTDANTHRKQFMLEAYISSLERKQSQ